MTFNSHSLSDKILKIVGYAQFRLISVGFFKTAIIFRVLTNITILFLNCLRIKNQKKNMPIKSHLLKFEINIILHEIFGKKFDLIKMNFYANEVLSGAQELTSLAFIDAHKFKKILIVGPSKINEKNLDKPDLVILLNPDLINLNLDQRLNYLIILNKKKSSVFGQEIINLTSQPCIIQILIKKNNQLLMHNDKVKTYNMEYANILTINGNGLNLLPISLLFVKLLKPELIEIIGCDFYLSQKKYLNEIFTNEKDNNVDSEISGRKFLKSLAFHNPYDQLTIYKLTTFWLKSADCVIKFDFDSVTYWQMASGMSQKFKLRYFNRVIGFLGQKD